MRALVRFLSSCLNVGVVLFHRARGIRVDRGCTISLFASIERSGGAITIGKGSMVDRGVILRAYGGAIEIGQNCRLNPYAIIYGDGGVVIGEGVRIAAHSVVVSANHRFGRLDIPIYLQGETKVGIRIEDDVWIGAGACVLDGVSVRRGCVIGAGAIVTGDTSERGVYVGVPARLIRTRTDRS